MIYNMPNKISYLYQKSSTLQKRDLKTFLFKSLITNSPGDSPPTSEAWLESTEETTLTALVGKLVVSVEGKTADFFVAMMTLL